MLQVQKTNYFGRLYGSGNKERH